MAKVTTTLTNGNDTKLFGADDDEVFALAGNDAINGGAGNDIVFGGAGNDVLAAGSGLDSLFGDAGIDTITYSTAAGGVHVDLASHEGWVIGLGKAADRDFIFDIENITGSSHNDILTGDAAANTISGMNGDDFIKGGAGADTLHGGAGFDRFLYTSGENTAGEVIDGGAGYDELVAHGTEGGLVNFEQAQITSIETLRFVVADNSTLQMQFLANQFKAGGIAPDVNFQGALNHPVSVAVTLADQTSFDLSAATLTNWAGSSFVFEGDNDAETVTGTSGRDHFFLGGGNDIVHAGAGIDEIYDHGGNNTFDGGADNDSIYYASIITGGVKVNLSVTGEQDTGGAGKDTITGVENLYGSIYNDVLLGNAAANWLTGDSGNDTISGGEGDDSLLGDAGNDILEGGADGDELHGGDGSDYASYKDSGGVSVALDGTLASAGDALGDTFFGIENLTGSNFDAAGDKLRGDGGGNSLGGLKGDDMLQGRNGADYLTGGLGADTLIGGEGADRFRWFAAAEGGDTITDFNGAFDFLAFKASAFSGLTAGQALTAAQFVANAAPVGAGAGGQFLYETDTGILSWDANGAGAGGATVIATLTGMPSLALDDFQIF